MLAPNNILVLDTIATALQSMIRINDLLQQAKIEGRDIKTEELESVMSVTDALENQILGDR